MKMSTRFVGYRDEYNRGCARIADLNGDFMMRLLTGWPSNAPTNSRPYASGRQIHIRVTPQSGQPYELMQRLSTDNSAPRKTLPEPVVTNSYMLN